MEDDMKQRKAATLHAMLGDMNEKRREEKRREEKRREEKRREEKRRDEMR